MDPPSCLSTCGGVLYIYEPGFRTTPTPPPTPHGDPPSPPVDVGVGWARVNPNNPNGTHGLHKGPLRTPTQLRPVLSTMGHLCLCCIHVVNSCLNLRTGLYKLRHQLTHHKLKKGYRHVPTPPVVMFNGWFKLHCGAGMLLYY